MKVLILIFAFIGFIVILAVLAIYICVHLDLWDDQPVIETHEIDDELCKHIHSLLEEETQIF